MKPAKSCGKCNKNYWWRDSHGELQCRSCQPPKGGARKPDWVHAHVWEYYTDMKPDNPEKIFLKTILTDVDMKNAWRSLSEHINKKFPYESERFLHFADVAFGCYLSIPAAEKLTKKEANDARDEAAKKARELAGELDQLGYWMWGPEDIAPDVMDWLSESEKDSWNSIHAINQTISMKRLLNRLADKLNTENKRPRVLKYPGTDSAPKRYMARKLAAYLKNDLQMRRGHPGVILIFGRMKITNVEMDLFWRMTHLATQA